MSNEVNNAKMRQALLDLERLIFDGEIQVASVTIQNALAEPLRNCDVGSAEEQDERFKNFCLSYYEPCNVDGECWRCPLFKSKIRCPIAWAQMPYEAKYFA